jgi:hypothetical protein
VSIVCINQDYSLAPGLIFNPKYESDITYAMLVTDVDHSAPDCSYRVYACVGLHASAHKLHTEFGIVAAIASVLHSVGWIARIVQYNTTAFLWETQVSFTLRVFLVFRCILSRRLIKCIILIAAVFDANNNITDWTSRNCNGRVHGSVCDANGICVIEAQVVL